VSVKTLGVAALIDFSYSHDVLMVVGYEGRPVSFMACVLIMFSVVTTIQHLGSVLPQFRRTVMSLMEIAVFQLC